MKILYALCPLALCSLAWSQGQSPKKTLYFDGVALQAGDDVITFSMLSRSELKQLKERPVTTKDEQMQVRAEVLRTLVTESFETQEGLELGLDPEAVRFQIQHQAADERAKIGAAAYGNQLTEEGVTALESYAESEAEFFRIMWRRSMLGFGVADLRATKDRYVRPGELRYSFLANKDRIAPPQVQYRILAVSSRAAGGPDLARALCEEARGKILEGHDMAKLVEEYGAAFRETQGLTPLIPISQVADPKLRELGAKEEGALTDVLPLNNQKGQPDPRQGYQLVMLHQKLVPEPPSYEDAEIQNFLRVNQINRRDNQRLNLEQRRIVQEAYSWMHPAIQGPGPNQKDPNEKPIGRLRPVEGTGAPNGPENSGPKKP